MDMQQICGSYRGKTVMVLGKDLVGREMSRAFAQLGANLVFGDVDSGWQEEIEQLAQENNVSLLLRKIDPRKEEDIRALAEEALAKFGHIDVLINSYRINILKPAEVYDDESWKKVTDMNLRALANALRVVGEIMRKQGSGSILNTSSVRSYLGMPSDYCVYCTTEGTINGITKRAAAEWAADGVKVNAMASTFLRSPINSFQLDDPVFYNKLIARIPMGRICLPRDVVCAAVFLCSDAAKGITGQILGIDGGLTAIQ